MVHEKVAAGFIIFRRVSQHIEYLLLQTSYGSHHWTPPKGHVDPGEDDLTAAKRETQEEAGLTPDLYKMVDNFKATLQYDVRGSPKTVHYWLAELLDPNTPIVLSDEHRDYRWGNLEESKALANFSEMVSCFDRAEQLLSEPSKSQ